MTEFPYFASLHTGYPFIITVLQPTFNVLLFSTIPNSQLDSEWMKAPNHHILMFDHPPYPTLLKEIPDPLQKLYIMGKPLISNQPQFAVVGSRNPTVAGCEIAQEMAEKLVQAGFHITGGLAAWHRCRKSAGCLKSRGPKHSRTRQHLN